MTNPFNTIAIGQNQAGEWTCSFSAGDGMIITLVCADEECARIMASHLEAMVKRGEVGEVAF
jgi:hypothetical protein